MMQEGTIATYVAAAAAAFVGLVQAFIYNSQRRIQKQAIKHGLFDRRLRIYHAIRWYLSKYIECNGNLLAYEQRENLDDLLVEAEFIFSAEAYAAIKSVLQALCKHEQARGEPDYDPGGSILNPAPPAPAYLMAKLKRAFKHLHKAIVDDLDLTDGAMASRRKRAGTLELRPPEA